MAEDPYFRPDIDMLVDKDLQKNEHHKAIMQHCLKNEVPGEDDTWVEYLRVKDIAKSTKLSVFSEDFGSYEYILEERGDGEEM